MPASARESQNAPVSDPRRIEIAALTATQHAHVQGSCARALFSVLSLLPVESQSVRAGGPGACRGHAATGLLAGSSGATAAAEATSTGSHATNGDAQSATGAFFLKRRPPAFGCCATMSVSARLAAVRGKYSNVR